MNRILLRIVLTEPGITFYGHVYPVRSSSSLHLYIFLYIAVNSIQMYRGLIRIFEYFLNQVDILFVKKQNIASLMYVIPKPEQ